MRLQYYNSKLKTKIRYQKEGDRYILLINKRILDEETISFFLKIDMELFEDMLLNTFKATKEKSKWDYPKYVFKTRNNAKNAITWLRSLDVLHKMCE